jgi:hypothetical protein
VTCMVIEDDIRFAPVAPAHTLRGQLGSNNSEELVPELHR